MNQLAEVTTVLGFVTTPDIDNPSCGRQYESLSMLQVKGAPKCGRESAELQLAIPTRVQVGFAFSIENMEYTRTTLMTQTLIAVSK
jgi:hypothetical protein